MTPAVVEMAILNLPNGFLFMYALGMEGPDRKPIDVGDTGTTSVRNGDVKLPGMHTGTPHPPGI